MGAVLQIYADIEDAGECPTCGVRFGMPPNLLRRHREKGSTFYCPNGHTQSFAKSEVARLREELEAQKRATERQRELRERAEKSRAAYQGQVTAIKNRVGNGVCPCCQRSFTNLRRHMSTKHPTFKDPETGT